MQHQVVAVGIREERHVADAGVEDVAGELDALGLELLPRRGHVVHVQRGMGVLLRRELHAEPLGLPDAEARVAGPDLGLRVVVGSQAERVDVEAA